MRLTLCLLTYNEIAGCKHDVPCIDRDGFDEVYAVDGGSADGTVEYLRGEGIPVYRQPVPSLNAACRHAVAKCSSDALVFFHPKGAVPPGDTQKFRRYFEAGYALVVASRNMAGGGNEEDRSIIKPRKWLSTGMALTAAALWRREGNIIWDIQHGFRGATMDAFRAIDLLPTGVSVDLEMVVRSYRLRLPRIEFPTTERARLAGATHFAVLPTGRKLVRYLLHELRRPRGTA
jgi:glycosyltransferase involved in cell wall biosynthesis